MLMKLSASTWQTVYLSTNASPHSYWDSQYGPKCTGGQS